MWTIWRTVKYFLEAEKDAEVRDKSSQMKDEDFKKQKIKPPKTSEEEIMTDVQEESK